MADTLTAQQRSANMRAVRSKNTAPELLVRSMLHRLGYRFRLHRRDLPGTPDIVFPARKSVLFVHGCFWHGHECPRGSLPSSHTDFWQRKVIKNKERDSRALEQLRKDGWKSLTVWECETKYNNRLAKRLSRFLERNRPADNREKQARIFE
ncbi:MAG: very short patch repair endonuclease [Acidiferrobacteraceae bacterium]